MGKSSKVTLQDIAKRANLSVSAVSLALRDHLSISDRSKRRIAEIVKALGYRAGSKQKTSGLASRIRSTPAPMAGTGRKRIRRMTA